MKTGCVYSAIKSTQATVADDLCFVFEVLPKPEFVPGEDERPIPRHLENDDWYWVRSLKTNFKSWFHLPSHKIKERNSK